MTAIRVLVADDQPFAIEGLCQMVSSAEDMTVVGQAHTIWEAVDIAVKTQPDVIVLDIAWQADREAGIKAISHIKTKCLETQILAVTVYPELADSARAAGVYALDKSFSRPELLDTIRWIVQTKGTPVSQAQHNEIKLLSPRELEILVEMAKGATDKQIAYKLYLAEGTVKKHVGNILGKLEVTSRTEAAVIAERCKLI